MMVALTQMIVVETKRDKLMADIFEVQPNERAIGFYSREWKCKESRMEPSNQGAIVMGQG